MVRARVEPVFRTQAPKVHIVLTIGLERAKVKIGRMNLVNDMKRVGNYSNEDTKRLLYLESGSGAPVAV